MTIRKKNTVVLSFYFLQVVRNTFIYSLFKRLIKTVSFGDDRKENMIQIFFHIKKRESLIRSVEKDFLPYSILSYLMFNLNM